MHKPTISIVVALGILFPNVVFASLPIANASGVWASMQPTRAALLQDLASMQESCSVQAYSEASIVLTKLGLFSKHLTLAQSERSVSLMPHGQKRFSIPIHSKLQHNARLSAQRSQGLTAYVKNGFLTIEQKGQHSLVSATFAPTDGGKALCQAVVVRARGTMRPLVIKNVFFRAQPKNDRLPNPWQEPPSILPPPNKRGGNFFERGAKHLFRAASMLAPFL